MEKPDLPVRWLVLFLACLMMIGNYYCYDNPSALLSQLQDLMPQSGFDFKFNCLYSVYSIPNMALPFFGGYFVDKLGAPVCLLVFSGCILCGQILFAFGTSIESWPVMLAGRVVFGLGGENMSVAQSALLAQWFKGRELAFAFGINLSISRLGSVINDFVSPAVANSYDVQMALWLGAVICAGSFVMAVLLNPIDRRANATIKANKMDDDNNNEDLTKSLLSATGRSSSSSSKQRQLSKETSSSSSQQPAKARSVSNERLSHLRLSECGDAADPNAIKLSDAKNFGVMFWLLALSCLVVYGCVLPFNNVAAGILEERNYFKEPPSDCVLVFPKNCTGGSLVTTPNPSFVENNPDKTCPGKNYATVLPTSLNYPECPEDLDCKKDKYVFDDVSVDDVDCSDDFWSKGCTKDYCDGQTSAAETSANIMSIPYFMSAGLSPPLGFAIDKIGKRAVIASIAPLMLVAVHSTLAFSSGSPILPLVGQGVAYSCFAACLWPSVPFAVEEKSVGTAYGLITAIQNSGLAAFPLVVSALKTASGHYIPTVEIFFTSCAVCGVVVGLFLNIMDAKTGGKLNMNGAQQVEAIAEENRLKEAQGFAPPTPLTST